MTEERLKLYDKAEKRIDAFIKTLSQDKNSIADTLKQENIRDFLISLWVDCSTEATKTLQEENAKLEVQNVELIGKVAFLENDLNNVKAQIDKMKRCNNCLYEDYDSWKGKLYNGCHKYSHWKLKEIKEK